MNLIRLKICDTTKNVTNPKDSNCDATKKSKNSKTQIGIKSKSQIMTIQKVKVFQFKTQNVTKLKNLISGKTCFQKAQDLTKLKN